MSCTLVHKYEELDPLVCVFVFFILRNVGNKSYDTIPTLGSEPVVQFVGRMTSGQKVWGSNSRPEEMGKIPEWSVYTSNLKTGSA